MFKKFVVFILFFCICCSSTTICNCYATDMTFTKLATDTDADFSDDKILVVLDNESSLKFKDYSESDFGSIACTNVTKLTKHSEVAAKLAVDNIVRHVTQGEPLREINSQVSNFNQILCLEISNPGKSNIIKAVNKLNKMDNILVACPNFKITSFQTSNDPHSLDYPR